ncbi:uncharacterized protein [Nyctibius grandis]|uniref:uncharacterized protein n=1 Tax=Nyctibius grandis TaxID=48427 RepID=UPI0035BBFF26
MNLLTQVSSSRQAVAGAASTAAFFLCEGLLGQHFDVVHDGVAEPQPGDLFLFPLASGGPGWWGAHAGVYCGDGEIIHLEGELQKHGKNHLLRTRGPAKVLRRRGGLDAAALQRRIRAAMDQTVEYDAVTCNCVHFALNLLGLGQLTGAMPFSVSDVHQEGCEGWCGPSACRPTHPSLISHSPSWSCQQPSSVAGSVPERTTGRSSSSPMSSSSQRQCVVTEFLLCKSIPRRGKVFEKVPENTLQPGDILLFPLGSSSGQSCISFLHAAVYCGDGEVIHFQNGSKRGSHGRIIKEGFRAMKKERGKCLIYRKKDKVDLNDFYMKVREVMNCEAQYHLGKNNCIHFALYLLGLVDFYMELVEIKKEDGSCGGGARSNQMV